MTLQERQLVFLLRWWAGLFTAAGICFAIFPSQIIYWLNTIGHSIFGWPYKNLPEPVEHFWQVLAVALLAVLTYAAFSAQSEIRQNLKDVRIIIISKVVTTLGFLIAFIYSGQYFAYLSGMIIDGVILFMTWFLYRRTVVSLGL